MILYHCKLGLFLGFVYDQSIKANGALMLWLLCNLLLLLPIYTILLIVVKLRLFLRWATSNQGRQLQTLQVSEFFDRTHGQWSASSASLLPPRLTFEYKNSNTRQHSVKVFQETGVFILSGSHVLWDELLGGDLCSPRALLVSGLKLKVLNPLMGDW